MWTAFLQILISVLLVGVSSLAQTHVDCKMRASDRQIISNGNLDQSFTSASLSKLAVTWWALEVLGAQYRFSNQIHVFKKSGQVRIHIEGGQDPIWSREKLLALKSALAKQGLRKIDVLTFDEHVSMFSNMQRTPLSESYTVPMSTSATAKNLQTLLPGTNITFQSRSQFQKGADQVYLLQGLPLVEILKYQNMTSNNYLADHMFWLLGGGKPFQKFLLSKGLGQLAIAQNNGSGLTTSTAHNSISCRAALEVLSRLQLALQSQNLTLPDVMLVEGEVGGTINFEADGLNRYVVKTGTLYDEPVAHVAGSYSVQGEQIYFADLNTGKNREAILQLKKNRLKIIDRILGNESSDPIFQVRTELPAVETVEISRNQNTNVQLKEKP